jgi:SPP1 gp7 family putative phage head morphogenesis protein
VCVICGIENKVTEVNIFTDDDFDRIITGILFGTITTSALDEETYLKIARELTKGVFNGFGKDLNGLEFDGKDYQMLFDLRENAYVFSGAKTYQQTRELSEKLREFLVNKDGIASLDEFKKQANQILIDYNRNWLTTEYHSAIAQARSASQWMNIEKDKGLYPMLTYHTVGDSRVRYSHAILDGVNKPINDKFWDKNFPPNDWNCRCTVIQGGEDLETTNMQGYKIDQHVNPIFQFNAGRERIVFSTKHPYFTVAPKDKNNALNNFGLPLP